VTDLIKKNETSWEFLKDISFELISLISGGDKSRRLFDGHFYGLLISNGFIRMAHNE
jgi:hypothetical protein